MNITVKLGKEYMHKNENKKCSDSNSGLYRPVHQTGQRKNPTLHGPDKSQCGYGKY